MTYRLVEERGRALLFAIDSGSAGGKHLLTVCAGEEVVVGSSCKVTCRLVLLLSSFIKGSAASRALEVRAVMKVLMTEIHGLP